MTPLAAVKHLAYGQVAFTLLLLTSICLRPEGLQRSMSYYGTCEQTTLIYGLAITLFSFFMLRATHHLPRQKPFKIISLALRLIAGLLMFGIMTPYTANPTVKLLHTIVSMAASDVMMALAVWLAFTVKRDTVNFMLLGAQLISGLVALLSLYDILPFFIVGEYVFELIFLILLGRTVGALLRKPTRRSPQLAQAA